MWRDERGNDKLFVWLGGSDDQPFVQSQKELFDLAVEAAEKWTCLFSFGFRCGREKRTVEQ